jgi:integrase
MKTAKHPSGRLMELLETNQPAYVGPVIWKKVLHFLGDKVQAFEIQNTEDRKISGLPPQILTEWFRQYCDTHAGTGGIAYSRRQRQNIRLAFEEVRKLWAPLVADLLQAIKNYPRSPRRGFIDQRGARDFQKGDLDRMRSVFEKSISQFGIFPRPLTHMDIKVVLQDELKAIKLYNLVFGLIINTGVTFPGCFSSICRLQRRHLPSHSEAELVIPRNSSGSLWLSITLDDISRISLLALLCHTSRKPKSQGIRRRQLRKLDGQEYLLGGEPSEKTIRQLRAGFNQWLRCLARQAGVSEAISLETLLRAAQGHLPEIYSSEVIAALTGRISYHPLPPDQVILGRNDDGAFYKDIEIPRWETKKQLPKEKREYPSRTNGMDISEILGHEGVDEITPPYKLDEDLVNSFFGVCQPYIQGSITSSQAGQKLTEWGKELLEGKDENQGLPELIKLHHQQLFQSNITMEFPLWKSVNIPLIQRWNLACIAGWLAWKLTISYQGKKTIKNPHTFLGYRRDILSLLRTNPQSALSEIGDDEMEEYFSGTTAAYYEWNSDNPEEIITFRTSTISCWRSIRHYLSREVGISLTPASLAAKSDERCTHYTRLISPEEVLKLLEICITRGTREAYCAYLAILLAYYSGLRAIEIVRLRLSQIVVRGIPTIFVQQGKGKKQRSVLLDDAPEAFVEIIKEARELRWREAKDLCVPLLAFPLPQATDVQPIDFIRAKKLSRWVVDIMSKAGLRSRNLTGDLPDLHRLRHSYINRSFLIRLDRLNRAIAERFNNPSDKSAPRGIDYMNDVRQISINAGHTTYQVTLEHYVHCLNLLQIRQLNEYQSRCDAVSNESEWLGRRSFEEILNLDHARAHQILRGSGKCVWRQQGQRRMLGIRRRDALRSMVNEILTPATDFRRPRD